MTPLYLIADRATCGARPLLDVLAQALDAGVRLVQLREKALCRDALRALADRVLALTARYDAMLLINSAAEVALEIGAQGVHLPSDSSPKGARDWALSRGARDFLIGYSAHAHAELDRAEGADFVAYSPIFAPGSKPGYAGANVGIKGLAQAVTHSPVPVYALGGMTPSRTYRCRATGCAGVAAMSGILAAADPGNAAREFLTAWKKAGAR